MDVNCVPLSDVMWVRRLCIFIHVEGIGRLSVERLFMCGGVLGGAFLRLSLRLREYSRGRCWPGVLRRSSQIFLPRGVRESVVVPVPCERHV